MKDFIQYESFSSHTFQSCRLMVLHIFWKKLFRRTARFCTLHYFALLHFLETFATLWVYPSQARECYGTCSVCISERTFPRIALINFPGPDANYCNDIARRGMNSQLSRCIQRRINFSVIWRILLAMHVTPAAALRRVLPNEILYGKPRRTTPTGIGARAPDIVTKTLGGADKWPQ